MCTVIIIEFHLLYLSCLRKHDVMMTSCNRGQATLSGAPIYILVSYSWCHVGFVAEAAAPFCVSSSSCSSLMYRPPSGTNGSARSEACACCCCCCCCCWASGDSIVDVGNGGGSSACSSFAVRRLRTNVSWCQLSSGLSLSWQMTRNAVMRQ